MQKIERQLEESYKSLRAKYRFTERENENFTELLFELRSELKKLRNDVKNPTCAYCGYELPDGFKHRCPDCYDEMYFPR